jgi:hypothetical protein
VHSDVGPKTATSEEEVDKPIAETPPTPPSVEKDVFIISPPPSPVNESFFKTPPPPSPAKDSITQEGHSQCIDPTIKNQASPVASENNEEALPSPPPSLVGSPFRPTETSTPAKQQLQGPPSSPLTPLPATKVKKAPKKNAGPVVERKSGRKRGAELAAEKERENAEKAARIGKAYDGAK